MKEPLSLFAPLFLPAGMALGQGSSGKLPSTGRWESRSYFGETWCLDEQTRNRGVTAAVQAE